FPTVGIRPAASGVQALTQLIRSLRENTGMGSVLVQHLDPSHSSALTELLARATTLPVTEVRSGMAVQPDHIYVIPPNVSMFISGGVLKLQPREGGSG